MRRIGIVHSSIGMPDGTPLNALQDRARALGLDGVMIANLASFMANGLSANLGDGRLAAGIGVFNPLLPDMNRPLAAEGGGDVVAGLRAILPRAAELGLTELFFVVGMIEDRYRVDPVWSAQTAAVTAAIRALAPDLRASGVRLLIKTHEEITSREILKMISDVGHDLLGVALDPVNTFCRMEDPLLVTRRLAGHVAQIHLDDAAVVTETGGLRRYLTPIGEGDVDWTQILALLPAAPIWIELHRGQFAWPAFDPDWLTCETGLELGDFASVTGKAVRRGAAAPWDQADPQSRLDGLLAFVGRTHLSGVDAE